jgi:hypothetical protein
MGPRRLRRLLPRAPTVCVTGKKPERKGRRPDRRVPHGSERRRKVGDSWAGWLCWAARLGGLRCSCRAAVQDGGGLADFYCCGYGPKCKGPFPIFLNPGSHLYYDSNLN